MADYVGSDRTPVNANVNAVGCTFVLLVLLVAGVWGCAASLQRIAKAAEAANQTAKEADRG